MLPPQSALRQAHLRVSFARPARRSQCARRSFRTPVGAVAPITEETTRSANAEQTTGGFFVACNNFKVKPEHSGEFEQVWKARDSHLKDFSGFIRFALLRGDEAGEYISMTTWASRSDFDAWRNSSQFVAAHQGSQSQQAEQQKTPRANMGEMLEGRPNPKFYEAVTVTEAS